MTDSPVGKRIRRRVTFLAAQRDLEVKEVLRQAEVSKYVWDKALAAKRGPRLVEVLKIANVLEVTISQIATDEAGWILIDEDSPGTLRQAVESELVKRGADLDDLSANTGMLPMRLAQVLDAENPGINAVKTIAKALEMSVDQLVGGEG